MAKLAQGVIANGVDDADGTSEYQIRNTHYSDSTLILGADLKNQISYTLFFRFSGLGILKKSTIVTAFITMEITTTSGGVWSVPVRWIPRDGVWDLSSFTGWRPYRHNDFRARIETSGASLLAESYTDITGSNSWELRKESSPSKFQKLAQGLTATASGSVATGIMAMRQTGSVSGTNNLWLELWSDDGAGLPSSLLATSTAISASSVPAIPAAFANISFSFPSPPSVVNNNVYHLVANGSYAIDGTNFISLHRRSQVSDGLYPGGESSMFGTGQVWDDQNFPGLVTFEDVSLSSANVSWSIPDSTGLITSPDLSALVQAAIDESGYDGDSIAMSVGPGDDFIGRNRKIAALEHATAASAVLDIVYEPQQPDGVALVEKSFSSTMNSGGALMSTIVQSPALTSTIDSGGALNATFQPSLSLKAFIGGVALTKISFAQGEDRTFQITVLDESETAVNITGATLTFTAKNQKVTPEATLITKSTSTAGEFDIVDAVNGRADLVIEDVDSTSIEPDDNNYNYDIWIQVAAGERYQIACDKFVIQPRVTVLV